MELEIGLSEWGGLGKMEATWSTGSGGGAGRECVEICLREGKRVRARRARKVKC